MAKKLPLLATYLIALTCLACGQGGGADKDPLKAALVSLDASPRSLQRGDRSLVEVIIREVDTNGVILKLRYGQTFSYVEASAMLTVDGETVEVNPFKGPIKKDDRYFLAFYFSKQSFSEEDEGKLTFQLRAVKDGSESQVAVDVDLHMPGKSLDEEFNAGRPLFGVEDEVELEVG